MEGQAERKKKTETRKGITISTKINNQGKEKKGANARMKTWTRNKEKRRSDNDLQLFAFFPNGHIDGWRQRKSLKRHLDGVACWHHCHLWYRQLGCTQESLFIISIRKCFFLGQVHRITWALQSKSHIFKNSKIQMDFSAHLLSIRYFKTKASFFPLVPDFLFLPDDTSQLKTNIHKHTEHQP